MYQRETIVWAKIVPELCSSGVGLGGIYTSVVSRHDRAFLCRMTRRTTQMHCRVATRRKYKWRLKGSV